MNVIRPQPGPQERFLSTAADVAVYGGAAFGGKTFALLMEPLRHINNGRFGATYFRREMPMITDEGAAWDTAAGLYIPLGAIMKTSPKYVARFPLVPGSKGVGMRVGFHHLQYESDVQSWQSAQIPLPLFDELTQFTERQFFFMLSRNRSSSGVNGYVRAACNPSPDSWVRKFLSWWIGDPSCPECAAGTCREISHGLPNPQRVGAIRYFVRAPDDSLAWADTRDELIAKYGKTSGYKSDPTPLSVTFIPSLPEDNPIGMSDNPGYVSKLEALPRWLREGLRHGNWNSRPTAGTIFRRGDFKYVDSAPSGARAVRYWDRAATEPSPSNPDPDWTRGVRMSERDGAYFIEDLASCRLRPDGVRRLIRSSAEIDGPRVRGGLEQEPGSSGVADVNDLIKLLAGFSYEGYRPTGAKVIRWGPLAAQVEAGNVYLVRAPWNEVLVSELESLTGNPSEYGHDDIGDAASGAFGMLTAVKARGAVATLNVW